MVPSRTGELREGSAAPRHGATRFGGPGRLIASGPEVTDMTAFGKILVFLNLIFALLTGALIGMVYVTRTNWRVNFEQVQAARQADVVSKDVEIQTERAKYQE